LKIGARDLLRDTMDIRPAEGHLARAALTREGVGDPRVLFDFNDMKFEPRTAPY